MNATCMFLIFDGWWKIEIFCPLETRCAIELKSKYKVLHLGRGNLSTNMDWGMNG